MELSLAAARGPPEIIGSGRQVMILPWRWDWLGHWTPRYILDLAAASGCDLTLALELALGFGCRGMTLTWHWHWVFLACIPAALGLHLYADTCARIRFPLNFIPAAQGMHSICTGLYSSCTGLAS